MTTTTILLLLLTGLLAGLLSSMVGIGGGLIIVPALILLFGLDQKTAQGTSLALLLLPLGIGGVFVYYKAGHVRWSYSLIMACTFVAGSYIGATFIKYMNTEMVKKLFALFMIIMGIKYLFFDKPKQTSTPKQEQTENN